MARVNTRFCMKRRGAYTKLVADLGVGLELTVIWAAAVAPDEAAVLVLDWVIPHNVRVEDSP